MPESSDKKHYLGIYSFYYLALKGFTILDDRHSTKITRRRRI